jgi:hypothetical protein
VLAMSGFLRLARGASRRFNARHATPSRRAQRELELAEEAGQRGDLPATAAALDRALHLAIEARTQLKARGFLRAELATALTERGIPVELANRVVELFSATEEARFVRTEGGTQAKELCERGRAAVSALLRGRT